MTTTASNIYNWFKTLYMHLWLSVSSINFYQQILSSYKGYGVRYILTVSFFSSLFCSAIILSYFSNINQYFTYGAISPDTTNIDHIISQFPELKYDGSSISLENSDPVYINNTNNQPVVVIDPENKLPSSERAKIPVLLAKRKIILLFTDPQKNNIGSFSLEYPKLFDQDNTVISQETIKSLLERSFNKAPTIIIYIMFPALALLIFFNNFLEKSFIIIAIYLLSNFVGTKSSMKTCIRVTMFSSGVLVLLQPFLLLILPSYGSAVWVIQIWANFLMVLGIIKFSNQNFFKFKK